MVESSRMARARHVILDYTLLSTHASRGRLITPKLTTIVSIAIISEFHRSLHRQYSTIRIPWYLVDLPQYDPRL